MEVRTFSVAVDLWLYWLKENNIAWCFYEVKNFRWTKPLLNLLLSLINVTEIWWPLFQKCEFLLVWLIPKGWKIFWCKKLLIFLLYRTKKTSFVPFKYFHVSSFVFIDQSNENIYTKQHAHTRVLNRRVVPNYGFSYLPHTRTPTQEQNQVNDNDIVLYTRTRRIFLFK